MYLTRPAPVPDLALETKSIPNPSPSAFLCTNPRIGFRSVRTRAHLGWGGGGVGVPVKLLRGPLMASIFIGRLPLSPFLGR